MFGFFRRRKGEKLLADAQRERREGQVARAVALLQEVVALDEPEQAGVACVVLAAIARERGDLAEAARHLAAARSSLPGSAAIEVQRGEDLRAIGRHEEAVQAFDEVQRCGDREPRIELRAARGGALSAFAVGARDARARLEDAVDRYALDGEAWSCLARVLADEGRPAEAARALLHVLRAYRDDLEAQERLLALGDEARARVLADAWRPEPATGFLDEATRRLFDHLRIGEIDRALALARSLGEPSTDRPKAAALRAFVELRASNFDAAASALAEAGELPVARFVAALSLTLRGREGEARDALERLREGEVPFPGLPYLLATCRDVGGDLDGAEALYEAIVKADPDDAEVALLLASVHRRRGRDDEARALERRAYLTAPVLLSVGARFRLDAVERRRWLATRARSELHLREAPRDMEARLALLEACNGLADYRATLAAGEGPPFEGPRSAALHREVGYARFALGDLEAAARDLQRSLALAPDDATTHMRMGEVLARLERHAEADAHLDASLRARPEGFHALATRAILLSMRGKLSAAAPLYRAAMRADPTQGEPHLNLAVDLMKRDKLPDAERELRYAVALLPDDPQAHRRHAQVLTALGRGEEASRAMLRAQSIQQRDLARSALGVVPPPLEVAAPSPFRREIRATLEELAKDVCRDSSPAGDR